MSARNRIAALCIGLNAVVELGVGVVYFTASEIMPYHKAVLGVEWSQLAPGVRTMFVAFINAYGSAHFATGVALGTLVLIPMRQGLGWARWAALGVGFPVIGATAWVSSSLGRAVEGGPPWQGALVLLAFFMLGVALYQPTDAARQEIP